MFSRVRVAIRFFFVGLAVGVLLAPRSGIETRRLLRQRADSLLNDLLDAATMGAYEAGGKTNGRSSGSRGRASTRSRETSEKAASASNAD